MKTLRQWTHELMHRQFLDGLIVGFLCGAVIVTGIALSWAQGRSVFRTAPLYRALDGQGRTIWTSKCRWPTPDLGRNANGEMACLYSQRP